MTSPSDVMVRRVLREFDESLHPRDEGGKFTDTGGGQQRVTWDGGIRQRAPEGTKYRVQDNPAKAYYKRLSEIPGTNPNTAGRALEEGKNHAPGIYHMYTIEGTQVEVGIRDNNATISQEAVEKAVETVKDLNERFPAPGPTIILLGEDLQYETDGTMGVTSIPSDINEHANVGALMMIDSHTSDDPDKSAKEYYEGTPRAETVSIQDYVLAHEWGHVVDPTTVEEAVNVIMAEPDSVAEKSTSYVNAYMNHVAQIADELSNHSSGMSIAKTSVLREKAQRYLTIGAKENFAESFAEYSLGQREGQPPPHEASIYVLRESGYLDDTGKPVRATMKAMANETTIGPIHNTYVDNFVGPPPYKPDHAITDAGDDKPDWEYADWEKKARERIRKEEKKKTAKDILKAVVSALGFKEFDESLHPRDERGEFTDASGGASTADRPVLVLDTSKPGAFGRVPKEPTTIKDFEKQFQKAKEEHGLIVRADGSTEMIHSARNEYSISLTDQQIATLKDGELTHNHPINGAPLSWADVGMFVQADMQEMRAITKDGYISKLTAPVGGWRDKDAAYKEAVSPKVVFGAMRIEGQKNLNAFLNEYLNEFATSTGATYTYEKLKK